MNSFAVISATELESSAGATAVAEIVHGFSCGRNREVDNFVRSNGLEFTRRKISVTHFVFEPIRHRCVGYFTLTHKPLSMPVSNLSRTQCSRISRFARTDVNGMAYSLSAFLIAQIGKNRNVEQGRLISGTKLLELAKDAIRVAQERIGGQVVFLEMEHGNAKLAKFYADNGFVPFGTRDDFEEGQPVTYDQLFLFLK